MRTTDHADTENLYVTEVKLQSTDRPWSVSDVIGDTAVTEIHEAWVFEQRMTALLGRSSKVEMKPDAQRQTSYHETEARACECIISCRGSLSSNCLDRAGDQLIRWTAASEDNWKLERMRAGRHSRRMTLRTLSDVKCF